MAGSDEVRGAATAVQGDANDQLRLQLAARRYDAHTARVLDGTLAALLSGVTGEARRWVRRAAGRSMRSVLSVVAPVGTARRAALSAKVASIRRPPRDARVGTEERAYRAAVDATTPTPESVDASRRSLEDGRAPLVSVVVADGEGDLDATLASIEAQRYDRVEVLIAASASRPVVAGVRLVVADGTVEHRCNVAAAAATGDFLLVLSAGDVLRTGALVELVVAVSAGADASYGDEERWDATGTAVRWHLKPATLGPETLLSYDVVGAPLLVRTSLYLELGGLDAACAPVAPHDFALRLAARSTSIVHVASVLLSRPASLDPDPADATAATISVVDAAVRRLGAAADVSVGEILPSVRVNVHPPAPLPSVTLVIPTRDRLDLLEACVSSVERRTTYANYSIVICDNDSVQPETLAWLAATPHTVVRTPGPFNYAAIVNRGVEQATSDFVVTLNNDTTIGSPDWLERLVGLCSLPHVGSVGVKLVLTDGRLQHEGVGIMPLPVHLSRDANYARPDRWLGSLRNATAVTGACQIVRRDVWTSLGGLDERQVVGYNDVDFGLRLCAAGWRLVYTPDVVLGHRESASRGNLHPIEDVHRLLANWDLLGSFQDPSVPPALQYVSGAIRPVARHTDLVTNGVIGPLLHGGHLVGVGSTPLADEHAALLEAFETAPRTPVRAGVARWAGARARAVLDGGTPSTTQGGTEGHTWARAAATIAVRARRGASAPSKEATRRYGHMIEHDRPSASALGERRVAFTAWTERPVVSVFVDDDGGDLAATLGSISEQLYDRVELLVRDRSGPMGASSTGHDDRRNAALTSATGTYFLALRAGDLLVPHCVGDLVLATRAGAAAAYGDERRHDRSGAMVAAHVKPFVLGEETLLSYDVVGAPLLVARDVALELGGWDSAASPAADHDFALRLVELVGAARVEHVSEVLVSRPEAAASDPADATAAAIEVVQAALARRGVTGHVQPGVRLPAVRYVVSPPTPAPSVAIVIPTRDRLELLAACVHSIESRSTYANYSIVICDNDSVEPATLAWLDACGHVVVRCPGPFNYASIVNKGAARTDADFIVTLNNDTAIATPDWLERLVGLGSLPGVASVGVALEFPDGRRQHEGVGIIPLPAALSRDLNYHPADRWLESTRNGAAVTGACQLVRSEAWRELGGLDERLAVAFNDVDFGMRLCAAGWRVVYTPEVVLSHHESATRGDLHPLEDEALLVQRWDLRGAYVDPSMPRSAHLGVDGVEFS